MNKLNSENASIEKPVHTTLTHATIETIRKAIEDRKFLPGNKLPVEKDLVQILGVSRTTLREALRALEGEGLIIRRRGLGTFVSDTPILKDLSINFGITTMINQAGYIPSTKILRIEKIPSSYEIASALTLTEGSPVYLIDRIRYANNKPIVWTMDHVPVGLASDSILDTFRNGSQSLYDFYKEVLQINIISGVVHLYPIIADGKISQKLKVDEGTSIMRITQVDFDKKKAPVMYSVEFHIPGMIRFVIKRKGPHY